MTTPPVLRPFAISDAAAMRALVLAGLRDHFGSLDDTLNPDLDDITGVYHDAGAAILIAESAGDMIGCGILLGEDAQTGRLVRMSVRGDQRGKGIGKALVRELLETARKRGYRRVVCETTAEWADARALYRACGFQEIGTWCGDTHFAIDLG